MEHLLSQLQRDFPSITFTAGDTFLWSPKERTVQYVASAASDAIAAWSLLHELAHATLDHQSYHSDYQLLRLEVEAWAEARRLADRYGLSIAIDHIQDCLDTYRDWLHRRSSCPACHTVSPQHSPRHYQCLNCQTAWQVSTSRFCRPYRMSALHIS